MIVMKVIPWEPIGAIPSRLQDGRDVLLWIDGRPALGQWDLELERWAEKNRQAAGGKPYVLPRTSVTHFAEIMPPE